MDLKKLVWMESERRERGKLMPLKRLIASKRRLFFFPFSREAAESDGICPVLQGDGRKKEEISKSPNGSGATAAAQV